MTKYLLLFGIIIFILAGCKKENNPVSNVNENNPAVSDSEKYPIVVNKYLVIDSLKVSAAVKNCLWWDTIATAVTLKLTAHFQEKEGRFSGFYVTAGKWGNVLLLETRTPIPVGRQVVYDDDFWFRNTFEGLDSIFVKYEFGGMFYGIDDTTKNADRFSFEDSTRVKIQR
jgi:hypothetical protein